MAHSVGPGTAGPGPLVFAGGLDAEDLLQQPSLDAGELVEPEPLCLYPPAT